MNNNTLSIQVQKNDTSFENKLTSEGDISFTKLETSSFDGQSEIVTLLITLSPMVIVFLGKVISEHIKSKKHIKIIYKGVQVQGISESNAMKLINEIIHESENDDNE